MAENNTEIKRDNTEYPIVAICGSAGSLEGFKSFFDVMPVDTGIVFIIVQHLHTDLESILPELIQRSTTIPVTSIKDNIAIQPNHIYVLPAGYEVTIWHGQFVLTQMKKNQGWPRTIDFFLNSLAYDQRENVVAIIFSGAGTDGVKGAQTVKEKGGLVIAQALESASQQILPGNIIDADLADTVILPERMPKFLLDHFRIKMPPTSVTQLQELMEEISEDDLSRIVKRVRRHTGRNFEDYKISTMRRQISRRMISHQVNTVDDYLDYLDQNPQEATQLVQYLLINVTSFFRDPEAFESLKNNALMSAIRLKDIDSIFRVWVPGCSSGEEAISIAICIYECLRELDMPQMDVRIFASDANYDRVQQARSNFYSASALEGMSEARLQSHFMQDENGYRVRNHIARMIIWSEHNLVEHPPFSQLHLISCRNVLIYFQRQLQERILSFFQFALRPEGILFLGSSETLAYSTEGFNSIDSKHKIYQRTSSVSRAWLQLDQPLFKQLSHLKEEMMPETNPPRANKSDQMLRIIKEMLIDHYKSTCLIIDKYYHNLYSFGEIDRYLRYIPGENVPRNVLEIAREGLDGILTITLQEAFSTDEIVIRRDVWVKTNGHERIINLIVKPIHDNQLGSQLKLVIFELVTEGEKLLEIKSDIHTDDEETNSVIIQLREELRQAQKLLQSSTQALQAKSEELNTSMEEIRSANEEIQTTNEELRTSKEELESMNEELNTLNTQLTDQNYELTRAKNTLHNFLQSTEIGMIFLDSELLIREYTSAVTNIFGLRRSDVGRPLSEIAAQVHDNDLITDAISVLDTLINIEKEVPTLDGKWYNLRIRPYRTTNNLIDGLVLTFFDITPQKEAQIAVRESEILFRSLIEGTAQAVWETNIEGNITRYSPSWEVYMGANSDEQHNISWLQTVHPEDRELAEQEWQKITQSHEPMNIELRLKHMDGMWRWANVRGTSINDENNNFKKWVGMNIDISRRKEAEQRLEQAHMYQEQLINTIENSLIELDKDLCILTANQSFYDTFNVTEDETVGKLLYELGNGQWNIPDLRHLISDILQQQTIVHNYTVTHDFPNLGIRTMRLNARQIAEFDRILIVITDISEN